LGVAREEINVPKIKSVAIAAALLIGASSLAMAQATGNAGNTGNNAAASGGPGTHAGAIKSGSSSNNQKVEKNQNGYAGGHQ
jgi:Spy/CpxP family protein refolding chaperone